MQQRRHTNQGHNSSLSWTPPTPCLAFRPTSPGVWKVCVRSAKVLRKAASILYRCRLGSCFHVFWFGFTSKANSKEPLDVEQHLAQSHGGLQPRKRCCPSTLRRVLSESKTLVRVAPKFGEEHDKAADKLAGGHAIAQLPAPSCSRISLHRVSAQNPCHAPIPGPPTNGARSCVAQ